MIIFRVFVCFFVFFLFLVVGLVICSSTINILERPLQDGIFVPRVTDSSLLLFIFCEKIIKIQYLQMRSYVMHTLNCVSVTV